MKFIKKLEGFLLVIAIFASFMSIMTFANNVNCDMQNNIHSKNIAAFVG